MATLSENITQAIADFDSIRTKFEEKGVEIPINTPTSQYASKMDALSGNEEWKPNSTWWKIYNILINDTSGNRKKYMLLITDSNASTTFTAVNAIGFKTSDGATYSGATFNHTWDTAQDKQCVEDSVNTYKTRWIMVYYSNTLSDTTEITLQIPEETLYMVIDTIQFTKTNFSSKRLLQSFDFINGSNIKTTVNNGMFQNCSSLERIPLLDFSNNTNANAMFSGCSALREIPLLDFSNTTNIGSMFYSCSALRTIPLLDFNKVTSASGVFNGCSSLEKIPLLDFSNVTNVGILFSSCSALRTIPLLDFNKVATIGTIFTNCYSLVSINIQNLNNNATISTTSYGTFINRTSLLNILNGLTDRTGLSSLTLTLGATNLDKLTSTEKLIATNKNWILN